MRIGAIKTELSVLNKSIDEWTKKAIDANDKDAEYQRLKDALTRTSTSYDKLAGRDQLDRRFQEPHPGKFPS